MAERQRTADGARTVSRPISPTGRRAPPAGAAVLDTEARTTATAKAGLRFVLAHSRSTRFAGRIGKVPSFVGVAPGRDSSDRRAAVDATTARLDPPGGGTGSTGINAAAVVADRSQRGPGRCAFAGFATPADRALPGIRRALWRPARLHCRPSFRPDQDLSIDGRRPRRREVVPRRTRHGVRVAALAGTGVASAWARSSRDPVAADGDGHVRRWRSPRSSVVRTSPESTVARTM